MVLTRRIGAERGGHLARASRPAPRLRLARLHRLAVAGDLGIVDREVELAVGHDWLSAFSLFGFVDYGAVWNPPGHGPYEFASLGSAGAGFRALLGRHTMISSWVAIPYKDEPGLGIEGTTVRFNAGVQF